MEQLLVKMILKQYILYFVCFDVSKHESNIYQTGLTADSEIKLLLDQVPPKPHKIYWIIFSERKATIEVVSGKLYVDV